MEEIGKIPGWIEKLLLPKLNELTGEIKAIYTRIDGVEKGIASLDNKVDVRMDGLRKEMLSKFEAVDSRFDSLEARIP